MSYVKNTSKAVLTISLAFLLGACTSPSTGPTFPSQNEPLQEQAAVVPEAIAFTVARKADGALELFARSADRQIYHRWQEGPGGTWTDWSSLGGQMKSDAVAVAGQDGKLVLFAQGQDDAIWFLKQDSSTRSGWSSWTKLGGSAASAPMAARNTEGNLEVFYRGTDNALWHAWETSAGGNWSSVVSLGQNLIADPSVVVNSKGRLQVLITAADHALWSLTQNLITQTGWGAWTKLGGQYNSAPAVLNAAGRLQVFTRGTDNALWHIQEKSPGGGWTAEASLGGNWTGVPSAVLDADGRLNVFARGSSQGIERNWQTSIAGNGWSGWNTLGGTFDAGPIVTRLNDGRLQVFARMADGRYQTRLQVTSAGSTWSDWVSLGSPDTGSNHPDPTLGDSLAARMLAPDNYYTRDLSRAPVDGNSGNMMQKFRNDIASRLNYPTFGGGVVTVNPFAYTSSFYTVEANTPRYTVAFNDCQKKGYTPDELYKAGGPQVFVNVPIPPNAKASAGTDGHLALYSPTTDQLWELWVAGQNAATGQWSACWGGRIDQVSKNMGIYPGTTGVSASGMVFPAAMITLQEVRQGSINHAMYMALAANTAPLFNWDDPNAVIANSFVWPAVRTDGKGTDPNAIPEGAYLRLDPTLNVDTLELTPFAKMVAKAAQKYGFVVMDKAGSSNIGLEDATRDMAERGSSVNSWVELFGVTSAGKKDWDWYIMRNFPWDKVSVLQRGYGRPSGALVQVP